jgi:hypothetical protein
VDRYSFIAEDLHLLLLAGLPGALRHRYYTITLKNPCLTPILPLSTAENVPTLNAPSPRRRNYGDGAGVVHPITAIAVLTIGPQ